MGRLNEVAPRPPALARVSCSFPRDLARLAVGRGVGLRLAKKSPFLESGLHLCLSAERTICHVWVRSGGDEAPSHPSRVHTIQQPSRVASRHGHFDSEIATHAACTPLFSRQSKIGRVGNCSPQFPGAWSETLQPSRRMPPCVQSDIG